MKKEIATILLMCCMSISMIACDSKHNPDEKFIENTANAEAGESEQTIKDVSEYEDIINAIISNEVPDLASTLEAANFPSYTYKSQNIKDTSIIFSYDGSDGTLLNITLDLNSKEITSLNIQQGDCSGEIFFSYIGVYFYLDEFAFTDEEIDKIAHMLVNETYMLELDNFKVSMVAQPTGMLSINRLVK